MAVNPPQKHFPSIQTPLPHQSGHFPKRFRSPLSRVSFHGGFDVLNDFKMFTAILSNENVIVDPRSPYSLDPIASRHRA